MQDVNNLFLIEGTIFTVEVNGSGYIFIFYFLLSTPSELKTSLSTKDDEIQWHEVWRYLQSLFKSKTFHSCFMGHELGSLFIWLETFRDQRDRARMVTTIVCVVAEREAPNLNLNPIPL